MKYMLLLLLTLSPCLIHSAQFKINATLEHGIPQESPVKYMGNAYSDCSKAWANIKLLLPQKNPDMRIRIKGMGNSFGKVLLFNPNNTQQLSLPVGQYSIECLTHDVYFGELFHESIYVKNDQLLRVPCGWFSVNENHRFLRMYCFAKGCLVDVAGRVADLRGGGIGDLRVTCSLLFDDDNLFWDKFEVRSNRNGNFVFKNLPPASIDRVVFFLLYGNPRYGDSFSMGLLHADVEVAKGETKQRKRICLVSEKNLSEIRPLAARIRSCKPIGGATGFQYVDENSTLREFPVSTNNVIYIGDIVLSGNSEKLSENVNQQ